MSDQYTFDDREGFVVLKEAWERVLTRLEGSVPETVLSRFLKPLKPVSLEEDRACLRAPGRFVLEWVREKYSDRLQGHLEDEIGRPVTLCLEVQARERPSSGMVAHTVASAPITAGGESSVGRFRPNPRLTFDNFVVGQSNRLAFAGAKAVAAHPGTKYNPLFIYGHSGLGKTHLLHAIANEILASDPNFPLVYISAQQFAEDFVNSLQNNRIDRFRRNQRGVSVWLVDDIQFIAGKDKTQEEIFHTFNYLHGLGKQIVLCSDRPPRDLLLMEERLRSRLESGLVADVQLPDTETRCAIVLKRAVQEQISIDHEAAMLLAEHVVGNVRALEGALTKLAAQASLLDRPIDLVLAQEVVDTYYANYVPAKPTFDQILATVSKHYQIDKVEITGKSRKAPIAHARHVAVFVTREILGDSWKHIGSMFGNKDHTSMMHGYKKIRDMMNRDKELSSSVKMLMRDLYPDA